MNSAGERMRMVRQRTRRSRCESPEITTLARAARAEAGIMSSSGSLGTAWTLRVGVTTWHRSRNSSASASAWDDERKFVCRLSTAGQGRSWLPQHGRPALDFPAATWKVSPDRSGGQATAACRGTDRGRAWVLPCQDGETVSRSSRRWSGRRRRSICKRSGRRRRFVSWRDGGGRVGAAVREDGRFPGTAV